MREGVTGHLAGCHPDFRDALAPLRYQALLVSQLTAKVVRRLEDAGVEVCVLEGAAVAAAAWDEPSARLTSDVDALVTLHPIAI